MLFIFLYFPFLPLLFCPLQAKGRLSQFLFFLFFIFSHSQVASALAPFGNIRLQPLLLCNLLCCTVSVLYLDGKKEIAI